MLLNIGLVIGGLIVGFIAGAITMFFVYRNNIKNIQKSEADLRARLSRYEGQAKNIIREIQA